MIRQVATLIVLVLVACSLEVHHTRPIVAAPSSACAGAGGAVTR